MVDITAGEKKNGKERRTTFGLLEVTIYNLGKGVAKELTGPQKRSRELSIGRRYSDCYWESGSFASAKQLSNLI